MHTSSAGQPTNAVTVSRAEIVRLSWPIVLANAAVPLLGLVDTAVIGNTGTVADLGAVALGALVFSFVYWTFGFLRMGTTGFVAQASGAGDSAEVRATVARTLLLGVGIGIVLFALRGPIGTVSMQILSGSETVESTTAQYISLRIFGAPAALATFAMLGVFVGLGRTKHLLATQLTLNGLNIGLDILFAGVLGLGVPGLAIGTAIAEWVTFLLALSLLLPLLRREHEDAEPFWPRDRIVDRAAFTKLLGANGDIMVRTLFLMLGFAWFTNQGALFGEEILAANHVLLQLVTLSAYLLDGYAQATEIFVGRAVGAGDLSLFDEAARQATEMAALSAVILAAVVWLAGPFAVAGLTDLEPVRAVALDFLPFAAVYVALSFGAFQLDGIFIGATGTRGLRNASVASCLSFIALTWFAIPRAANTGLWLSFILYVVLRAIFLGSYLPGVRRELSRGASVSE
ncbi:MAG: MATE family efflux transporter [Gemmatimonadota bacterium]